MFFCFFGVVIGLPSRDNLIDCLDDCLDGLG